MPKRNRKGSSGTQSGEGVAPQRPEFVETGDSKLFGKPVVKGAAKRQSDSAKLTREQRARTKRLRELHKSIHGEPSGKGSRGTQSGEGVWRK